MIPQTPESRIDDDLATTLQFTFEHTDPGLQRAVNVLWLVSLILSIGSATNSLLTLAWRQAVL